MRRTKKHTTSIIILAVILGYTGATYANSHARLHEQKVQITFIQKVETAKGAKVEREGAKTGGLMDKPQPTTNTKVQSRNTLLTTAVVHAQERTGAYRAITLPEQDEVANKIRQKFGEDGEIAVAVARCESGLRPHAIGDGHIAYWAGGTEYGKSYGVFQIRHLEGRPSPDQLLDLEYNLDYAYNLYKMSGWQPWTGYTNGCYKSFMAHL